MTAASKSMNISVEKTLAEQSILTAEQVVAAFAEVRAQAETICAAFRMKNSLKSLGITGWGGSPACYENYGQLAEASADGFEKNPLGKSSTSSRRRWKR